MSAPFLVLMPLLPPSYVWRASEHLVEGARNKMLQRKKDYNPPNVCCNIPFLQYAKLFAWMHDPNKVYWLPWNMFCCYYSLTFSKKKTSSKTKKNHFKNNFQKTLHKQIELRKQYLLFPYLRGTKKLVATIIFQKCSLIVVIM